MNESSRAKIFDHRPVSVEVPAWDVTVEVQTLDLDRKCDYWDRIAGLRDNGQVSLSASYRLYVDLVTECIFLDGRRLFEEDNGPVLRLTQEQLADLAAEVLSVNGLGPSLDKKLDEAKKN